MLNPSQTSASNTLLRLGFVLFLLGLLTGFGIPAMANPRMGLASHLEGVMNGIFLIALAFVWPRLQLGRFAERFAFSLAIYGTFANWAATFLAALWGAGHSMPIAAGKHQGIATQEAVVDFLLYSLSFAMVILTGIVIWGLRSSRPSTSQVQSA